MLKKLRVLFAVVMGVVITFYFLDFAGLTTGWPNLARIQFDPGLIGGEFRNCIDPAGGDTIIRAYLLFGDLPDGYFSGCRSLDSEENKS